MATEVLCFIISGQGAFALNCVPTIEYIRLRFTRSCLLFAVGRSTLVDMNAEPIHAMLHRQPFTPFEVHLANGEVYEVRHRENAIVMKSNLMLVYPEKDTFVIAAIAQVSNVQPAQHA